MQKRGRKAKSTLRDGVKSAVKTVDIFKIGGDLSLQN